MGRSTRSFGGSLALLVALVCTGTAQARPLPASAGAWSQARAHLVAGSSAADRHARLAAVRRWFYMLDVNLEQETVQQIAQSGYDLAVLDFIPSEAQNTDYPMAAVVRQLHTSPHPKLVLAYIDIGQAESFRSYWQHGWKIGNPAWIVGGDPDGWQGNYPVAYWRPEWRRIWLGKHGTLQRILDAGFDGVYLDWVEAYSDSDVVAAARRDGVDPQQEMIRWVGTIAGATRAQQPGFLVVGQNASELAAGSSAYRALIDAVSQEQTWFDGASDNNPPGDCPLPRTDDDVDTPAYRDSLSPPCRAMYDRFPDSTLHVSSASYLHDLRAIQRAGTIVFTVDYAQQPMNVIWVYRTARGLGFVPFVGTRTLDHYIAPVP